MESGWQTFFLGYTLFMLYMQNHVVRDNKSRVEKLDVHTHAADGSINGISGWY